MFYPDIKFDQRVDKVVDEDLAFFANDVKVVVTLESDLLQILEITLSLNRLTYGDLKNLREVVANVARHYIEIVVSHIFRS